MNKYHDANRTLNWENLLAGFRRKRCILMLGPRIGTVQTSEGIIPMLEWLSIQLSKELENQGVRFDQNEKRNLNYIAQHYLRMPGFDRTDLTKFVERFVLKCAEMETPPIYHDLAKLPVRVFVSTTPDDFIVRALRQAGREPMVFTYNFNLTSESHRGSQTRLPPVEQISVKRPLVINLLGSADNRESFVLSETDEMDFIEKVVRRDPPIPDSILNLFDRENSYLFFGFNLENWQFRLLLKSLKLDDHNLTVSPQTDNYPITDITRDFLEEQFNFIFVDDAMASFAQKVSQLTTQNEAENLFISFAPSDSKYGEKLVKYFHPLRLSHPNLQIWNRNLLEPGQNMRDAIEKRVKSATHFMLLISPDYLSDDAVMAEEFQLILDQCKSGTAEIIPILLRPCMWEEIDWPCSISLLPDYHIVLADADPHREDENFQRTVVKFKRTYL